VGPESFQNNQKVLVKSTRVSSKFPRGFQTSIPVADVKEIVAVNIPPFLKL